MKNYSHDSIPFARSISFLRISEVECVDLKCGFFLLSFYQKQRMIQRKVFVCKNQNF